MLHTVAQGLPPSTYTPGHAPSQAGRKLSPVRTGAVVLSVLNPWAQLWNSNKITLWQQEEQC